MFLALKEIKYEKLRYGLITLMIFLISYLIFMLSSLAVGLASQNTQAVNSWQTKSVVLNDNANVSLSQSLLTKADLKDFKKTSNDSFVGLVPIVVKEKKHQTISAQFVGLKKDEYIYKDLELVSGRKARHNNEIAVDQIMWDRGYRLGDKVTLNGSDKKYKIVGFLKNAKINIAPIAYGTMATWRKLRPMAPNVEASGIISKKNLDFKAKNVKSYDKQTFINKLPGYTAQNSTFELMIGFLFVISLIIIAVFLYILTMQKMPNYAVLRAQGIPSKTLIGATLSQSLILVILGTVLAYILMLITVSVMPATVPINFAPWIMISTFAGMILMGIIGGLIPIKSILKVDPSKAV